MTKRKLDKKEDQKIEKKDDEKRLIVHRMFDLTKVEKPINCVYILKLLKPGVNCWYVGYAAWFPRRIRQHNSLLKVAKQFTTTRSSNGKYKWHPVCILSGESLTQAECLGIEAKVKNKRNSCPLRLAEGTLAKNGWKKKDGTSTKLQIKRMLIVANLPKWTQKCTRSAIDVPLTLSWYLPSEMPHNVGGESYLPSYITEEIVDNYQLPII
jgi:predicted GIY-YIG superfamily endonuclease